MYIKNLNISIMEPGYLHILIPIIISFYGVWAPPFLDPLFVIFFLMLNISWIIFKDECIVSYFHKKQNNPNYKLGDNIDISDNEELVGKSSVKAISIYLTIAYLINLVFILSRLQLALTTKVLIILSYVFYVVYMILLKLRPEWIIRILHLGIYSITLVVFVIDILSHGQ